jgi:hypothetical protein
MNAFFPKSIFTNNEELEGRRRGAGIGLIQNRS